MVGNLFGGVKNSMHDVSWTGMFRGLMGKESLNDHRRRGSGSLPALSDRAGSSEWFTLEEHALVEKALQKNLMFKELDPDTIDQLLQLFAKEEVAKGEVIVEQGDAGEEQDCVSVIAEGECSVIVNGKVIPEPYGTLKAKSMFGELGIMQNNPKAPATIQVKSDKATLFRANRTDFKQVLYDAADFNSDDDDSCYEMLLDEIDEAINQVTGTKEQHNGHLIKQCEPRRAWLWARWRGTVVQHNARTALLSMLASTVFVIFARSFANPTWPLGFPPDPEHPLIQHLHQIQELWLYQMTLTTFILTFYVNQAFGLWNDVHQQARGIQGRINDVLFILASCVQRNQDSTYTAESEALLDDVGSSCRIFHILFWASCCRNLKVLTTRLGLERMAQRGMITMKQLEVLESLIIPDTQRHTACLEWMMVRARQGVEDGTVKGGQSTFRTLLETAARLRAVCVNVQDILSGWYFLCMVGTIILHSAIPLTAFPHF